MLKSRLALLARLRSYLLIAAGIALIAASLAWDFIRGAASFDPGRKQIAGCLAGVALFVMGVWLGRDRAKNRLPQLLRPRTLRLVRWAAVLVLLGGVGALSLWLPRESLFPAAAWILWAQILALALLLPLRLGWLLVLAASGLNLSLAVVDAIKVGLTGLPLTMLDIQIAAANPAGLWEALHLPAWTRYATIAGIALAGLYLLYELAAAARRVSAPQVSRPLARRLSFPAVGLVLLGVVASAFFSRLFDELGSYSETWDTVRVTAMAEEIGVLPYLAYSQRIESTRTGDFFNGSIASEPPSEAEIREAVLRHVEFRPGATAGAGVLPNIVILLAESTFDPNKAFRLDQHVPSSLFEPGKDTVAVGPFRVNVVGGGTWVTEFETIVGLDSRMFGYSGYYTHSSLSPYVSRDLVTQLKSRGYRTSAFFPHEGKFYNYRNAYRAYGVEAIYDNADLGRPDAFHGKDTYMIDDFRRITGPSPEQPFFSYVLLTENHGPHQCQVTDVSQMPVHFADTDDFEPNCLLHEYLRRLKSTEAALASLLDYLRGLEARDGRPFVLLVYGDHQPYTFTGNEWVKFDFNQLRTPVGPDVTFFHLFSSAPGRLKCCLGEIPATLVPTLVSAYTARDADDLYLGINFWLFDKCGPDPIASGPLSGLFHDPHVPSSNESRTEACAQAYRSALAAFRQMQVIASPAAPAH